MQDQAASVGVLFMILERQSGILSKVLPRLVGVVHDLGGEGLEGGELPLLPQVLGKTPSGSSGRIGRRGNPG